MSKTALIFGVSGQDGAYLAKLLLDKGYIVHGTSRDAEIAAFDNLVKLGIVERVQIHSVGLTDFRSIMQAVVKIEPDEIYNLAAQSSVSLSFEQPVETMESISGGTLNILEVLRILGGKTRFYSACSSECFGDTNGVPANEETPFKPCSPYAVAKAAAFWQVVSYRDAYGIQANSGILFNHESPLRHPRYVTRKIVQEAARIAAGKQKYLTLGNLDIKRDWGWAPEYVEVMWRILQNDEPDDFVIATGESHSLREFIEAVLAAFDLESEGIVRSNQKFMRPNDIAHSVGDASKAASRMGWRAKFRMGDVVRKMVDAEKNQ